MKGRVLGILVLLIWGLIKLPIETKLTASLQKQRLGGFKITASLRQQAGQAGVLAALGGLRAAVADLLWIRAHVAWQQKVEYGRMKLLFDVCTTLQPRRELFYDVGAWHMAWNGAAYVERTEPDPEVRQRKMTEFYKVGEAYLLQGIENIPESWKLYERLGALYNDKFHDHWKAHLAYVEAAKRPGRLEFVRRLAVFQLAEVPGKEQEAYAQMLALYQEGKQEWVPTLLKKIQTLEKTLNIPEERRIKTAALKLADTPGQAAEAYEQLRDLFDTGGTEPDIAAALLRLEPQLNIPEDRRILPTAARLAQMRTRESEGYEQLAAIYRAGAREPGLLEFLGRLEEKLDIPKERRVHVPPTDRR